ncbi:RNA-guided endonuclease InsQ/TnpB family protein [Aquifex aeolicus]|nr:RNA-guided endonuclease TnpB family protein [Aquifex aeolicus]
MQTLTLEISTTKRSVLNKLKRASLTFQQFKNLLYLCLLEYYKNTKDVKPFLSVSFLEKFVKGKENLPFENEKIKSYREKLKELWEKEIGSDTVKALARQVSKEVKSVLEKWKKGERAFLPRPRKLKKVHKFTVPTNPNMLVDKRKLKRRRENSIVVRLGISFGAVKVKIPQGINIRDVKITWYEDTEVIFRISYEVPKAQKELLKEKWLSIDLGVRNLVSCISNDENLRSFIVDGNPLKSFNQWVNKLSAKLRSEGKERLERKLWRYRKKRIKGFFHQVANLIVRVCLERGIGRVIIPNSLNEEYQKDSEKGARFNQEFRFIPLGELVKMIEYKCELCGIEVVKEDESWTSKVSSVSGNIEVLKEEIPEGEVKKLKFEGRRIKRGLFRDRRLKKVFNADLNGALNLAIKALGKKVREEFLSLRNWLDKLSRPVKVNLFRYPASLPVLWEIAGSKSCSPKGDSEGHFAGSVSDLITFAHF